MFDSKPKYLAVDIGGTKIEVCTFGRNFNLLSSKKVSTKDFPINSMEFLKPIKDLLRDNFSDTIKKIGISFNCVVHKGVITYSSLLGGYSNFPLSEEWSKEFNIPVVIENDVNAMALAESEFGHGKNRQSMLLINIGTGIRLSFIYEGKVIHGFTSNLGEISQRIMTVPELSDKEVNIDDFLSGKGISNIYKDFSGDDISAKEIFSKVTSDNNAQAAVNIFTKYFSRFLSELSYFYNPEIIVLNGSLKHASEHFLPQALDMYYKQNFKFFYFKDVLISEIDHGASLGAVLVK